MILFWKILKLNFVVCRPWLSSSEDKATRRTVIRTFSLISAITPSASLQILRARLVSERNTDGTNNSRKTYKMKPKPLDSKMFHCTYTFQIVFTFVMMLWLPFESDPKWQKKSREWRGPSPHSGIYNDCTHQNLYNKKKKKII